MIQPFKGRVFDPVAARAACSCSRALHRGYLGIGAELKAALAEYSARDREEARLDVDEAVRHGAALQHRLGAFEPAQGLP